MAITVILIAVLGAIAIWWLSRQRLAAKPWLEVGVLDESVGRGRPPLPAATIGLGVFLAVVTSLFALLVSAYSMRMRMGDWQPLPIPWLLWVNTGVLLASSAALFWAQLSVRRGRLAGVRDGLLAGGATALLFLVGQFLVFRKLSDAGFYLAGNPASSFFYLITSVHGLHLLGGMAALARTAVKVQRRVDLGRLSLAVNLCAVYWHFLLLVWLGLFVLLLRT
jgi:cytochrome c oxidase subunit 3